MGMVGLETALAVVQRTMVDTGLLTWSQVAERMSAAPARIGDVDGHGGALAEGEPANVVLYDPADPTDVDGPAMATKSSNTPFRGMTLPGRVSATFLRGTPTVLEGRIK